MDPTTPTLDDVITEGLAARLRDVHVALPGRIVRYDAAKQVADIQPVIRYEIPDEDGAPTYEELPVLPNVPVLWPRTGAWFLALPLAAGDTVQLLFNERAIGHWRAGAGDVAHPGDLRLHDLSHAVAIPGLFPTRAALQNAPAEGGDMVIGNDDGTRIAFKPDGRLVITQGATTVLQINADGTVNLGAAAGASFVALASAVNSALSAIRTAFNAHTHAVSGAATLVPATLLAALPDVAATKAKAT